MENGERQRLLEIIRRDSLLRGDFTLASGKRSTYYINAKKVILKPEGCFLTARVMLAMIPSEVQAVGGVPIGAIPIVSSIVSLSFLEKKPVEGFLIRKEAKGYGTNKLIEGDVSSGMKVIIIEDVVTSGGSLIKAVAAARDHGLDILKVISLVDREEGGSELLRSHGLIFQPVFTVSEILG